MTLMIVGPIEFQQFPLNMQGTASKGKTKFAEHDVLGTAPVFEHTGFDADELTIKGKVVTLLADGRASIEIIEQARQSALPLPVTRGDGVPFGFYVIEESESDHSEIGAGGVGREIEVKIKLKRVATPGISLAGAIFSLFPINFING